MKIRKRAPTDAEILAQLPAARKRARTAARLEPRAESAWYDASRNLVMVQVKSGPVFGFSPSGEPDLRQATPDQLAAVEVFPGGEGLHWEELDADISVPGLIWDLFGVEKWAAYWSARKAGSRTSPRKAAAARANGAKGGRPRVGPAVQTRDPARPAPAKRAA